MMTFKTATAALCLAAAALAAPTPAPAAASCEITHINTRVDFEGDLVVEGIVEGADVLYLYVFADAEGDEYLGHETIYVSPGGGFWTYFVVPYLPDDVYFEYTCE